MPEAVKQAVSATSRVVNAVLNAVGGDSPTFGFFGHTKRGKFMCKKAADAAGDHEIKPGKA